MKVNLVKIGNSKGVRIPMALLEQVGLTEHAEVTVAGNAIVLKPAKRRPRENWDTAIAAAIEKHGVPDEPLLPDHLSGDADEAEAW